ncbi:TIM44-like domain-containing protein [Rhodoplanes sp. Z2-YC6860]|uniref:TIM44-like domain-containing protein n=1 Tax=Rhodoplanes sp. Z2-YC6860 TaxID=674703 RepID=UPI00078D4724|nr:TIM44-like domain-containing protein [Rhodoplanes sp. Z2-YC6860]AMN40857.1 methyltransferase, YaeB/AF_0241 family [Rhodoplanes sp. Z2-YC6860]
MFRNSRRLLALAAMFAALSFTVVTADARPSSSFGSRGSRTYSAPAPTATAPNAARPMDRTMTQPSAARPGTPATAPRPGLFGGMFGGGMLGGLAAGFLGAGLFGMLFGHGFLGGMGGFASFIGLLFQIILVVIVARLAWAWWQRRNEPATAGGPSYRQGLNGGDGRPQQQSMLGGLFGGGSQANEAPQGQPIELQPDDFNTFEKMLGDIQTAYGREDLSALRSRVTPEMLSYYSDEMAHNASNGDVNQISDVKLLQGDLSEAWREGSDEYATVSMRYSLKDRIVARDDGKLIEQLPSEAKELWTFRRTRGGHWLLSGIQQTS